MSDSEVNPIAKQLKSQLPPTSGKRNKRKRKPFYRTKWFAIFALLVLVSGGIAFISVMAYLKPLREQAESIDINALHDIEKASLIFDRRGTELGRLYMLNRTPIKIEQVPVHFIQALTSQEDERFFQHSGVDMIGILRAMWLNYKAGAETQGASTITQQLAREAFNLKDMETGDKNSRYNRKIVEWFAAERIEKEYEKYEILELYLNRIYFGGGFYGIQAASQGYFGKDVGDLTIDESATLCGIIKSPNNLQPRRHPERAKKVRDHVLDRMVEEGYLSRGERDELKKKPVVTADASVNTQESYVYEAVRQEVIRMIGSEAALRGGFNIYTTIDNNLQKAAEASVLKRLAEVEKHPGYAHQTYEQYHEILKNHKALTSAHTISDEAPKPQPGYLQAAVLAIDNADGGILAMVGGRDFRDSEYNRALQSRRPVGTAFVPFVYATAFQSPEYFPALRIEDGPIDNRRVMIGGFEGILGEWGTEQDKTNYEGQITAREALVESRNAATVRLGEKIGLPAIKELVAKTGISSPVRDYPSSYLGASEMKLDEMCLAYSTFANSGNRPKGVTLIHRITDYEGKVIYQIDEAEQLPTPAIDPIAAYQIHSCLVDALKDGTGKPAYAEYGLEKFPAAGKTGTHYEFKDLWFMGYTSGVTCGVWAGFDQQKPIYMGAFSNRVVLPIWTDVMNATVKDYEPKVIEPPANVQMVEVCRTSGLRATAGCFDKVRDPVTGGTKSIRHTFMEVLRPSSILDQSCDIHQGDATLDISAPRVTDSFNAPSYTPHFVSAEPVRMQSLTVVGIDPFNTVLPVVKAEPVNDDGTQVLRAVPVEEPAEVQNPIKLAPPPPLNLE